MNKVILSGRLVKDIELRKTQNGESVVSNSIAVNRDFKNAAGEYETDFIDIVVWRQSAEYLSKYAKKGDRVELVGRWQIRSYTDKNNATRYVNECLVENITVFSSQPKDETKQEETKPVVEDLTDDDLPF